MADAFAELKTGATCLLHVMGERYQVSILDVGDDTVWVSFPARDYPIQGMGLDLEFHNPTGVVIYHTYVVMGPREHCEGIVLQRTASVTRRRHRSHYRVHTNLTVWVQSPTQLRSENARMLNISAGGALIDTYATLEPGSPVVLTLTLPQEPTINVKCDVIHAAAGELGEYGAPNRYGLRFTEVPAAAARSITYFVWRCLRDQTKRDKAGHEKESRAR